MLVTLTLIRPMFPSIGKVNLLTYDRNIGLIWVDKMTNANNKSACQKSCTI